MRRFAAALLLAACTQAPSAAPSDAGTLAANDSRALLAEVDRLQDTLKDKPKTFEVLSALGNLYYENGRYLDAVDAYRQAEELSAPAEAEADALRRKGVKPTADLPVECRRSGTDYGLTQIFDAARKLDAPRELRCLDTALEMALAARARRGNSFYLIGNPDAALAEHRKVLSVSPDYPESLFFVGAIVLEQSRGDKEKLAEGKKYWKRMLEVAPGSPRAGIVRETLPKADEVFKPQAQLPAGHPQVAQDQLPPGHPPMGQDQLPPGHPSLAADQLPPGHPPLRGQEPMAHSGPSPEEVRNVAEAVAGTEQTPELSRGLDELLAEGEQDLDQGKYQEARDAVVRVMPMRPNDARTAAALGGAMRGLGRMEMAERTLSHALQLDPRQPRALYEMGKLQESRGDKEGAARTFAVLKTADAKFAQAHKVDEELARLR